MSSNTNWDVDSYKTEYEPDEHWELRRSFMLTHQDKFSEDELVCLAQVFTNVEFLGCRYPLETMQLVAQLSQGVADEFREKQKSKLKRTFVEASDAATSKITGQHRALARGTQPQNPPTPSPAAPQLPPPKKSKKTSKGDGPSCVPGPREISVGPYGKLVIVEDMSEPPTSSLIRSCTACNIPYTYEYQLSKPGLMSCILLVNNQKAATATDANKKSVTLKCTTLALKKLKETCYTIKIKLKFVSESNNVINKSSGQSSEVVHDSKETPLAADNVGSKMMRMMGWNGGGLGKSSQGIMEPVRAEGQVRRAGLGISGTEFDHAKFAATLYGLFMDYKDKDTNHDLIFSSEFSKVERGSLHRIARGLGLKSTSYGSGAGRHLVVTKKECFWDIACRMLRTGKPSEKYELEEPSGAV